MSTEMQYENRIPQDRPEVAGSVYSELSLLSDAVNAAKESVGELCISVESVCRQSTESQDVKANGQSEPNRCKLADEIYQIRREVERIATFARETRESLQIQ